MGNSVRPRVVCEDGRYNGRSLVEWLPEVVGSIVERFDPLRVILFGSLARGDEGPDSDIDLLVVLERVDVSRKRELRILLRRAVTAPVPVDVFVTDPEEIARRRDVIGSFHYWPMREGRVVYERAA